MSMDMPYAYSAQETHFPKTDDTNTKPATTTTKRPVAKPATTTKRPVVKQQITNVKK